ncbi:hypothetical protein J6590_058999 [Homalodisca vitripennis]|nr:hypothetical protein J6590_058999 [Homalodisca vitripennis]
MGHASRGGPRHLLGEYEVTSNRNTTVMGHASRGGPRHLLGEYEVTSNSNTTVMGYASRGGPRHLLGEYVTSTQQSWDTQAEVAHAISWENTMTVGVCGALIVLTAVASLKISLARLHWNLPPKWRGGPYYQPTDSENLFIPKASAEVFLGLILASFPK